MTVDDNGLRRNCDPILTAVTETCGNDSTVSARTAAGSGASPSPRAAYTQHDSITIYNNSRFTPQRYE